MKQKLVLGALTCLLGMNLQVMGQISKGGIEPAPASPVVNAYISGPANVCPNDQNVLYTSSTNWSGLNYWVEFTCGGAGVIAESGTQSYIIYNTGNNNSCHVNWGNYNGSSSWVQVTYHWTILFVNYSTSAVQNTDIGIVGPNAINGPASICSSDVSTNFNVSCPNSLPTGAIAYSWSATNATIVSGWNTNTISMHAVNSSPMVVTVKYSSTCGGYSSSYSYTIQRTASLPLGAGYILQHLESMSISGALLVDLTFPSKPYSYNYHCIVTDPSSMPVNYTGTVPANTSSGIQVALNAVGSTLYVNANYGDESCGNYWNYARGKGGLIVGSHNRMSQFDENTTPSESNSSIVVFPNPAKDLLTIRLSDEMQSSVTYQLTDMLGHTIINQKQDLMNGENIMTVQLSNLPGGVYFLNVTDGALSAKKKIVIEN